MDALITLIQTAASYVVPFLALTLVIVFVHEMGHFLTARYYGVTVEAFSIGFGKVLLRWKARRPRPGQDTEFVICAFPLGGYVRMLDEREAPVVGIGAALDKPARFKTVHQASHGDRLDLDQLGQFALGHAGLPLQADQDHPLGARHAVGPEALLHHAAEETGRLHEAQGGFAPRVILFHGDIICVVYY